MSSTETIVSFLTNINIPVVEQPLPDDTFLPGLHLKGGSILMDRTKLKYPGDLLHEAGHIAVTEKQLRSQIGSDKMHKSWPTQGDEIATILWSFAAATHLNLDISEVFHPNGYQESSDWFKKQFNEGNYMGLPLLEWMELCDAEEFPRMKKWLR